MIFSVTFDEINVLGSGACKTVIIDGIPQICDIGRLVYDLNNKYEGKSRKLTNNEKINIMMNELHEFKRNHS